MQLTRNTAVSSIYPGFPSHRLQTSLQIQNCLLLETKMNRVQIVFKNPNKTDTLNFVTIQELTILKLLAVLADRKQIV